MSEIADVLNKAADLIEKRGLYKGSFASYGKDCSFCTVGALMVAAGYEPQLTDNNINLFSAEALDSRVNGSVVEKAINALAQVVDYRHVPAWNDRDETTQDDVVRTLREVAANV